MNQSVDPETYARAMQAANSLKSQLEGRLLGRSSNGWPFSGIGPSRVVGITVPPQSLDWQIAMWKHWQCEMKDENGKRWKQRLNAFIHEWELYPMFRSHFAGIDVYAYHRTAKLCFDRTEHLCALEYNAKTFPFIGSGRIVRASNDSPAYVRPRLSAGRIFWTSAELRCDQDVPGLKGMKTLLACNIDPFDFQQMKGHGFGSYYSAGDLARLPTFYVNMIGSKTCPDIPIARLLAVDEVSGEAVFELERLVESFRPPRQKNRSHRPPRLENHG